MRGGSLGGGNRKLNLPPKRWLGWGEARRAGEGEGFWRGLIGPGGRVARHTNHSACLALRLT